MPQPPSPASSVALEASSDPPASSVPGPPSVAVPASGPWQVSIPGTVTVPYCGTVTVSGEHVGTAAGHSADEAQSCAEPLAQGAAWHDDSAENVATDTVPQQICPVPVQDAALVQPTAAPEQVDPLSMQCAPLVEMQHSCVEEQPDVSVHVGPASTPMAASMPVAASLVEASFVGVVVLPSGVDDTPESVPPAGGLFEELPQATRNELLRNVAQASVFTSFIGSSPTDGIGRDFIRGEARGARLGRATARLSVRIP